MVSLTAEHERKERERFSEQRMLLACCCSGFAYISRRNKNTYWELVSLGANEDAIEANDGLRMPRALGGASKSASIEMVGIVLDAGFVPWSQLA